MELAEKIAVPTSVLDVKYVQKLLGLVKDDSKSKEFWGEVANSLWTHLKNCLDEIDDQLLCATCFYTALTLASKRDQDYYVDKLSYIVGSDIDSPSKYIRMSSPGSKRLPSRLQILDCTENERKVAICTLRVVSLIYGMFQSPFLIKTCDDNLQSNSKIENILKHSVDLLLHMGYEYSDYTFLVFKIMTSFKKVYGGSFEQYIFNNENNVKLLVFINNNWENPVTGVRDLNRSIFQTVLLTLNSGIYTQMLKDINGFYWNKSKFLMLADIIDNNKENINTFLEHKWIDGLMYSLHKPGLVSAGADMYHAILKKINTQDDWCQFFLYQILNILKGTNSKAIENFSNYWCLTTMKKFKTITNVLIEELEIVEDSEQLLYSKLNIMKQANKLAIIEKNWALTSENTPIKTAVLTGIKHCNYQIRMLAFEIVSVSLGKSVPCLLEYNLILDYLQSNVNSDSTVLRLSMLSCFNYFLTRLYSTYLNVLVKTDSTDILDNLFIFCRRLQIFIENNISVNGNYQRKITSLKLFDLVLTNSNEVSRSRKDVFNAKQSNKTIIQFLTDNEHWLLSTESFVSNLISLLKDPADDIRETVIKILLSQYTNDLHNSWTNLYEDAKKSMKSKYFYEISCGQSMLKLIKNLLRKEELHKCNEWVKDILEYAYSNLITHHLEKTNVLNSIERGQQLHSYMSIMITILEDRGYNYLYPIEIQMSRLLEVLESVSNQFAWVEEGSSDFSEINDMIQNIITTSDYSSFNEDDLTHISGLQQIVLNCLWLNVKASCDLASILIQYNVDDAANCERCLNIITHVLETSRHKGAIEAAGAALGRAINYLTTLTKKRTTAGNPKAKDVFRLPYYLLKSKLNEMISETNKMSSVTRRGAGLSIMFHRMVSSDMEKGKPLFHYFIKTLLEACRQSTPHERKVTEETEKQVDIPIAIYIHFMTRIVTDSGLATDFMYYSSEIAELAFKNLTSSHWQIRNAALQLYGALVPRLIGQKKASGTDDETIATVACDEMRTHFPRIWTYITNQLILDKKEDAMQTHSNLVPILSILGNSAKRYNLSLQVVKQETEFGNLFYYLIMLLGSPIYNVRCLTAKAIFNIYDLEYITTGLLSQSLLSENQLHGMLLLLNLCYNYYASDPTVTKSFQSLRDKFDEIFSSCTHSYLCKKLYEDIYVHNINLKYVENVILELNANKGPGIEIWAESHVRKYIEKCIWDDMPSLLNLLLKQPNYEEYLSYLESKLIKNAKLNISTDVLMQMANILIGFENRYNSSNIWKILYEISRQTNINTCINLEQLFQILEGKVSYKLRYMVPLAARYISNADIKYKTSLMQIINDMSDFENSDVGMRHIASLANNEVGDVFNDLPDLLKVISIKCAVLLLQDEDEDVRNLNVQFYSSVCKDNQIFQPYICLNKILDKRFLNTIFADPSLSIKELQKQLTNVIHLNHNVDDYNPFRNDFKNIYFEPHVLKQLITKLDA